MARYAIQLDDERDWNVRVGPGLDALILSYRCPACQHGSEVRLQPPPWHYPAPEVDAYTYGGTDGHHRDGFTAYEFDRSIGAVPHVEVSRIATQLWCHPCGAGADAVVSEEAA